MTIDRACLGIAAIFLLIAVVLMYWLGGEFALALLLLIEPERWSRC